jgi:hypothetical protein
MDVSMPQEKWMRALIYAGFLAAALPAAAQTSPYAGEQPRDIKALSADETADLLAGRGMGLARAAELNRYPGPLHVLELEGRLGLSDAQRDAVQASFARMRTQAQTLGTAIIERERALDAAFKAQTVSPDSLAAMTADIAALQGRLRAAHLAAHLETRAVLTPQQIALYDRLRGYAGGAPPAPRLDHASLRSGRASSALMAAPMSCPWFRIASTVQVIGMSTLSVRASAATGAAEDTPSATERRSARMSSSRRPWPSPTPSE